MTECTDPFLTKARKKQSRLQKRNIIESPFSVDMKVEYIMGSKGKTFTNCSKLYNKKQFIIIK